MITCDMLLHIRTCTTTNLRNLNGITKVKNGVRISNSWMTKVMVVTAKSNLKQNMYVRNIHNYHTNILHVHKYSTSIVKLQNSMFFTNILTYIRMGNFFAQIIIIIV